MLMLPSRTSSGTFHSFPYREKRLPSSFPLGSLPQLCKTHHKHLLFTLSSQNKNHPNISYLTWPRKLPCLYPLTLSAADTKTYMWARGEKWRGKGERRRRRRGQLPTEVNPVTHSGCGYEPGSRLRGGKDKEGEGQTEAWGSAGKVFPSWCERRERQEANGAGSFFSYHPFHPNSSLPVLSPPALTLEELEFDQCWTHFFGWF